MNIHRQVLVRREKEGADGVWKARRNAQTRKEAFANLELLRGTATPVQSLIFTAEIGTDQCH